MTTPQEMVLVSSTHPILHQVAREVPYTKSCEFLFLALYDKLNRMKAVGIAAPQIGVSERAIIIAADAIGTPIGLINPVITKRWGGKKTAEEGCLSYRGSVSVSRYKRVTIEGYTHDWKKITLNLRHLAARIAQHEVDHLNGITIMGGRGS